MKIVKFVARVNQDVCTGAKLGQYPRALGSMPFCQATCPMHIDVKGYTGLIREGKFDEALRLIRGYVPFPEVLERICPHPCESECFRGEIDEPIAINVLKRSAGDYGKAPVRKPADVQKRKEKVAVIGSGPAGLTAAYYLVREGYPVTVFEKLDVAGGMMAVGIAFRNTDY
jgi:NADPH-dependent glutamate synthase beta subunit-like oxidoreductase